jgi:hypothetical protein
MTRSWPSLPGEAARRFGATYSGCGLYRYHLWREWNGGDRMILWIMLNPSTADHLGQNDPTIERCERRSAAWGFARMEVVNLFALRSTDPAALRRSSDPVGPGNDEVIEAAAARADMVLCAWGAQGGLRGRDRAIVPILQDRAMFCLGRTRSGAPAHPLYLANHLTPVAFHPDTQ